MKKLLGIIFLVFILFSLLIIEYLFPISEKYYKTELYYVENESGFLNDVLCYINKDGILIAMFSGKERIHVHFKEKRWGLPNYGFKNFKIKDSYLFLYKENLFYKDGNLFKPFIEEVDQLDFNFIDDKLIINDFGLLKKYGEKIVVISK